METTWKCHPFQTARKDGCWQRLYSKADSRQVFNNCLDAPLSVIKIFTEVNQNIIYIRRIYYTELWILLNRTSVEIIIWMRTQASIILKCWTIWELFGNRNKVINPRNSEKTWRRKRTMTTNDSQPYCLRIWLLALPINKRWNSVLYITEYETTQTCKHF